MRKERQDQSFIYGRDRNMPKPPMHSDPAMSHHVIVIDVIINQTKKKKIPECQ
jgi:hypothetical protein